MVRSKDSRRRIIDAVDVVITADGVVVTTGVDSVGDSVLPPPPTNMEQFSSKLSRNDDMIDIRRCCRLPSSFNTLDSRRCGVLLLRKHMSSNEELVLVAFVAVLALVVESLGKNFSCILDKSVFDSNNIAGVLEPRR